MTNISKILVGIRDSQLSQIQTDLILNKLKNKGNIPTENSFEIKLIKTRGDTNKDVRLDRLGGKGLFIKEIEQQILNKQIDIGIHSMKDVPSQDEGNGLEIICWMQRETNSDALLSNSGKGFFDLPSGSVIGTSSIRRRAQILNLRKDLQIKLLRGNVDTRIDKLHKKKYDAIILSLAGIQRLNKENLVTEILDHQIFLPAACQGVIGVQGKKNTHIKKIFNSVNDLHTQDECTAERNVLRKIKANCNSPVSVFAKIKNDQIEIKIDMFEHSGNKIFDRIISGNKEDYMHLSNQLGNEIIDKLGQDKINRLDELNDFDYTP